MKYLPALKLNLNRLCTLSQNLNTSNFFAESHRDIILLCNVGECGRYLVVKKRKERRPFIDDRNAHP